MIHFFFLEPGSTVGTSLSEGEQMQKDAGILHIYKKTFTLQQRPLQPVRQFYFVDINLSDHIDEKALKTLSNSKLEQKLDKILTDTVGNTFCSLLLTVFISVLDRSTNYSFVLRKNILAIRNNPKSRRRMFSFPLISQFLL